MPGIRQASDTQGTQPQGGKADGSDRVDSILTRQAAVGTRPVETTAEDIGSMWFYPDSDE